LARGRQLIRAPPGRGHPRRGATPH
jgi:hypothetical protein